MRQVQPRVFAEPPKLDDLDYALIEALRHNAKASNTELADKLGVAKRTVASRITRLAKMRVMRVTATFDIQGAGFSVLSIVTIRVSGRLVEDVARDLVRIPETTSVQSVLGSCDLHVTMISRDWQHLIELVEKDIGRIKGISDVRCEQVLTTRLLRTDLGVLREELDVATPRVFFDVMDRSDVGAGLDELDRLLIVRLQENGRTPLTQIAREADVSEGTVRFRLKRLEKDKRLRVSTVVDAGSIGYSSNAYIALTVKHDHLNQVADALAKMSQVSLVAITLSHADIWTCATARTRAELASIIQDQISLLPGMRSVDTLQVVHLFKHDYRWNMRLAGSEAPDTD